MYFGVALSALTIVIANNIGWRNSFRLVSGVSLLVTGFTFFISEPKRGQYNIVKPEVDENTANNQGKLQKICNDLRVICSNKLFIILICGSSLRFFGGYATGFWSSKFYLKQFPKNETEYSIAGSILSCICGMTG